jgi:hypothetical protein
MVSVQVPVLAISFIECIRQDIHRKISLMDHTVSNSASMAEILNTISNILWQFLKP